MASVSLLFVADIVGKPGLDITESLLPGLREKYSVDFCIANGENLHEGKGLNEVMIKHLYKAGVDVITGGNHSFDKHLIFPYMNYDRHLLRPQNYPKGAPGYGSGVYDLPGGKFKIAVLNLQGRTFLPPIDCPFRTADKILPRLSNETKIIIIDMHAEATAEKMALGRYLDGKASAVIGTHTHAITADEQILLNGTAYITDAGFTGAYDSVIGLDTNTAIQKHILQIPHKHVLAQNDLRICGLNLKIDPDTGKTLYIERIREPGFVNKI